MAVEVKICGLTRLADVEAVNAAGADYAGFVFFEKSKRNISFALAKSLLEQLDPRVKSVAVCVSPDEALLRQLEELGFSLIQIHGQLNPRLLDSLHTPVWQAINLSGGLDPALILDHPAICGCVIDGADYGGGKTFGWEDGGFTETARQIREMLGGRRFVLAGGLTPENVELGISLLLPDVVDVSSGVEGEIGKDAALVMAFTQRAKSNQ